MYGIYDYIHNGIVFVNNVVRKQHKELTSLMILHNKLSISLQALFHLEETRGKSQLR